MHSGPVGVHAHFNTTTIGQVHSTEVSWNAMNYDSISPLLTCTHHRELGVSTPLEIAIIQSDVPALHTYFIHCL